MSSIMGKVRAYSHSVAGKERMSSYINQCIVSGNEKTGSGSEIVTIETMEKMASILAQSIISTAASYDLPPSVMDNINSIACSKPYKVSDDTYRVDLYFTADLSRESLYSEEYDGIVNIIALFNNGYLARDFVYGYWDHHKSTGDNNILRQSYMDDFTYVRSKISRPGLQFMQEAVNNFNDSQGSKYHASVILDEIYEEVPTVAK